MYRLENDHISISVSSLGAELVRADNKKDSYSYIWNGNPQFWRFHAPICFPIVGRLKKDTCRIMEDSYTMTVHGFAREMSFALVDQGKDFLEFQLSSTEETQKRYPFPFLLTLHYRLEHRRLSLTYRVKNCGSVPMPFSIGAHTAYCCPLPLEDPSQVWLEFEKDETFHPFLLKGGFLTGEHREILATGKYLSLDVSRFHEDILILEGLNSRQVTLCQKQTPHKVTVDFGRFPFLGIWSKPEGAPFVCIEPWDGLPDLCNGDGILSHKEAILTLAPGEVYEKTHSMTFH